ISYTSSRFMFVLQFHSQITGTVASMHLPVNLILYMKTWLEAQSYCREKHTDLISGTKQLQDEEVRKLMNSSSTYPHIGLFRDTWRWSDGNSFSFRHWNNDFNYPQSNSGQCAMTVFNDGGKWRNVSCKIYLDKYNLICSNK
uniref:C-type lectin domain-containing protein n=1 Tax=Xiphophorus couchianus TaxID=32473 RepID=A0A3B5LSX0_9TELE